MLHDNKALFEQIILLTANDLGIEPSIVEKDYFVTITLKRIVEKQSDIIFKGGTSLSKCYKLINRFSEDIDLNIEGKTRPAESQRKTLKANIVSAIDELSFELVNSDEIRSRRDFNKYKINYPTVFKESYLKNHLIIETAVFFRSYPCQEMKAGSFIYEYLLKNNLNNLIEQYDLAPFDIKVQTAERTFIDKIFALGDYYLTNTVNEHSRHIYDLYKLLEIVKIDDDLRMLAEEVREERKTHKTCLSAHDDINMNGLLQEILDKNAYKADYEDITSALLFDDVDYKTAVTSLEMIISQKLFK